MLELQIDREAYRRLCGQWEYLKTSQTALDAYEWAVQLSIQATSTVLSRGLI